MRALLESARQTLALVAALLLCAPLLVLVSAALFAPGVLPSAGQWWPEQISFASFGRVLEISPLALGILHSLLLATAFACLSVFFASISALGLYLSPVRLRMLGLLLLIVAASIPYTNLWLPRFLIFKSLGMNEGVLPLLAPALIGGSPLFILLYFFSFQRLPAAQFEIARLEALSPVQIWWRVAFPQLSASHFAVFFLSLAWSWGQLLDPLVYLRAGQWQTAPLVLQNLALLGQGELNVWMAGACLISLPILLLMLLAWPWLKSTENQ